MTELGKENGRDLFERSLPLLSMENNIKSILAARTVQFCRIVQEGHTNVQLLFIADSKKYIYRTACCAEYCDIEIDYSAEAAVNSFAAAHGIDNTFVHLNANNGDKIAHYLDNSHVLDESCWNQLSSSIAVLRKFHSNALSSYPLTAYLDFERLLSQYDVIIRSCAAKYCAYYSELFALAKDLYHSIQREIQYSACHFDCHQGNFLFDSSESVNLIDYEHCKYFDSRFDLASLAVNCNLNKCNAEKMWAEYYGNQISKKEIAFLWKMCILCAFYNIQWAIYVQLNNIEAKQYIQSNIKYIGRYYINCFMS